MVWNGLTTKILDGWSSIVFKVPRWFSANGYNNLSDPVDALEEQTLNLFSFTTPVSGIIPSSWFLSSEITGSVLNTTQGFFNTLQQQINPLYVYIEQLKNAKGLNFDLSELDRIYYSSELDIKDQNSSIFVKTSSGFIEIPRALNEIDFFTKPVWSYLRTNNEIIINGIGITEQISNPINESYFKFSDKRFDESSLSYYRHPVTKNWHVLHPNQVRSDGVFPITSSASTLLRSYSRELIDTLDYITILVDNKEYQIDRINVWNTIDDKGLWFGINRREGEASPIFADKILSNSWFNKDQASYNIKNLLAVYFDLSLVKSEERDDFSVEPSYKDICIKDQEDTIIVKERLKVESNNIIKTIFPNPTLGFLIFNNQYYSITATSGIVSAPQLNSVREGSLIEATWFLPLYTFTSSGVSFSSNFSKEGEKLITLHTKGVSVNNPSTESSIKSFNRTWPGYRWNNINPPKPQEDIGLSIFD